MNTLVMQSTLHDAVIEASTQCLDGDHDALVLVRTPEAPAYAVALDDEDARAELTADGWEVMLLIVRPTTPASRATMRRWLGRQYLCVVPHLGTSVTHVAVVRADTSQEAEALAVDDIVQDQPEDERAEVRGALAPDEATLIEDGHGVIVSAMIGQY